MKKAIYLSIMFLMISLTISAQAAGGQIIRKRTDTTVRSQKQSQRVIPRSNQAKPSSSSRNVVKISEPDGYINGHGYVDLGLPSGTKWATCNVGADSPEQYGNYFAWGETIGYSSRKTDFFWITYRWCSGSSSFLTKYNTKRGNGTIDSKTELDHEDDVAYVNCGADWRMPSIGQFEELINSNYTNTTWTTQNGVNGYIITSKNNGKSIFLPAAGYRDGSSLDYADSYGVYWSRTLNASTPIYASYLFFYKGCIKTNNFSRYCGRSVRPVLVSKQ